MKTPNYDGLRKLGPLAYRLGAISHIGRTALAQRELMPLSQVPPRRPQLAQMLALQAEQLAAGKLFASIAAIKR